MSSRPLTPYSLHDSGVEEAEEASLIPMESICEQLLRAFRLNRRVYRQYEEAIIKSYPKKSPQKVSALLITNFSTIFWYKEQLFYC